MALEIVRGNGAFAYRIDPKDACVIQRRMNKGGARWTRLRRYATADEARQALLTMDRTASNE